MIEYQGSRIDELFFPLDGVTPKFLWLRWAMLKSIIPPEVF